LCGSRKYPYPGPQRVIGNSEEGGGGALKTKLFKGKYEPELEFQRGGGSNQKKPLWGWEYGYFLEQNMSQVGLAMEYLAQGHSILTEHSEVCMLMRG